MTRPKTTKTTKTAKATRTTATGAKRKAKKPRVARADRPAAGLVPKVPLSAAAAKQALAGETKALRVLCGRAGRESWQIGKRLSQIAELGLHRAAGFSAIEDYAERELDLSRTKAFQLMRVAAAFSEAMVAEHGVEKLEAALAYFKATPEHDGPDDLPELEVRVLDAKGAVHPKSFDDVTVRELSAARKHELAVHRTPATKPEIAAHTAVVARGLRALRAAVGRSNAPRVALELRSVDGLVTLEVRGVPLAAAGTALAALGDALAAPR